MKVLRVMVEAPICSFRLPHFLVGRHLTFDMPPPSTIYGHVCSAAGKWLDPDSFEFGYHFEVDGRGEDLEHLHMISPSSGKLPGTEIPKVVEGSIQPTRRQLLFGVKLTLYLTRVDLMEFFLSPRFPMILGRSQDLADCLAIEEVELVSSTDAYFEGTLLPANYRRRLHRGTTMLMSRVIGPPPQREVLWDRYIILRERVFLRDGGGAGSREMLRMQDEPLEVYVDPDSPEVEGLRRAVVFHSFLGD